MILDGKLVAKHLDNYTQDKINQNKEYYDWKYVCFLLFSDDRASKVYVNMKKKKAEKFGIQAKVIEQPELTSSKKVIWILDILNNDEDCIGYLIQLPLNKELQQYQWEILAHINPKKDIDGLWWVLFGLSQIWAINFLPATVRAIFEILKFYKIWVWWKNITVIGQSNLIWKPTATECMKQMWTVFSFNSFSDIEDIKNCAKKSDIIISATWKLKLIDQSFLSKEKMQVLVDVGWGEIDGKACGDFDFENIETTEHMFTPVPWGVWPTTVSSIFANLVDLKDFWI